MRQSQLFTKTRKEAPTGEEAKNARLLVRAGFINKEMAGVYSYLPLGLRVLNKVNNIIREEMDRIGGQELLLSAFQDKEVWEKSNRWSDEVVDNWFKTKLKNGGDLGLGFTHEEPLTKLMTDHIKSYRDLPVFAYQIQTKFRNEARAKSGLMRCREFLMKDLYSFCKDEKEHNEFYEKAKSAYLKIFERVGIGENTFVTFASGGTFSKYSHEFQTISDAGEDIIYVDEKNPSAKLGARKIAVNKEVMNEEVLNDLGLKKENLVEKKAIEVGNIFSLGTKFSEVFGLNYLDEKGEKKLVVMGSYGIGPGRLIGTVVETLSDEKGLVWPKEIAPFSAHLIEINPKNNGAVRDEAKKIYDELTKTGIETLWDDREFTAGEKFADADLIGIPVRLIVSEKTLKENKIEVKDRATGKISLIAETELIRMLEK